MVFIAAGIEPLTFRISSTGRKDSVIYTQAFYAKSMSYNLPGFFVFIALIIFIYFVYEALTA